MIAGVWAAIAATGCEKRSPEAPAVSAAAVASDATANAGAEYVRIHDSNPDLIAASKSEAGPSAAVLEKHASVIEQLVAATRMAECDFGVDRSQGLDAMMPHLGKLRSLYRVLQADAKRCLEAGKSDEAAQRTAAMFRLGRHCVKDATAVIEWLVGVAIVAGACDFTVTNPALASAAWKTDIQTAILECTPGDPLGFTTILKRDGVVVASAIRSAKIPRLPGTSGRDWTNVPAAERESIAKKFEAAFAEGQSAIAAGDSAKLKSLRTRADAEGYGDVFLPLDSLAVSLAKVRASLLDAQTALAK